MSAGSPARPGDPARPPRAGSAGTGRPGWDARDYDARFGYVTAHGQPVLELLAARPGQRILDLGCGTGHQAAAVARLGCTVVGLDADPAMLAQAEAAHGLVPRLTFVQADAQAPGLAALPGVSGLLPFDAVVSNAALHWMPAAGQVLANVRSLLAPGGRLVAEQGGRGNVQRCLAAIAAALAEVAGPAGVPPALLDGSSWFPSPGQEAPLLETAGFVVRRMELVDRPTPLGAGVSVADWAAMFRPHAFGLVPTEEHRRLRAAIDDQAAARGLRNPDGSWWADYVRLRFVAEAS